MNLINKKYSRIISPLVLFFYSALFLANIFHHHSIELNTDLSFKASNNFKVNNHFAYYTEFNCPIHNNFNSVHNLVNLDSKCQHISLVEISPCKLSVNLFYDFRYYHLTKLRGPPLVIS